MLSTSRVVWSQSEHLWRRIGACSTETLGNVRNLHGSTVSRSGAVNPAAAAGAGVVGGGQVKYAQLSRNPNIVHRNIRRKMKKGMDRLPSQGPDPSAQYKHGWRLAAAAVLERYPLVIPECSEFEATYQRERFLAVQALQRPMGREWFLSEKDKLEGREPQLDDPRAEMYTPGPRVTEADRTGDIKSMDRALDQRLYLVVKRTHKAKHWQFPQVLATDRNVSMREYTSKALFGVLPRGPNQPRVHYLSYIPTCHLEHVFPKEYREKHDVYGVKIFFYRVMLMKGVVDRIENNADFAWATDEQLKDMLSTQYFQAIKPMLVGVGPL